MGARSDTTLPTNNCHRVVRRQELCYGGVMLDRLRRLGHAIADWCSFEMGTITIWLHPRVEMPIDRAIREEGERLRKAFPTIDFDNPRPRLSGTTDARFR
jgi:hypothetical protein